MVFIATYAMVVILLWNNFLNPKVTLERIKEREALEENYYNIAVPHWPTCANSLRVAFEQFVFRVEL